MIVLGCRGIAAASLALAAAACAGCMHDIFGGKDISRKLPSGEVRHGAAPKAPDAAAAGDWSNLLPGLALPGGKKEPPPGALRGEQVAEVIEGLQALDRLDPPARAAIQASLDRTSPANWPYVFRFHREALAGAKGGLPWSGAPAAAPIAWGFPANETAAYQARKSSGQPLAAAPPAAAAPGDRVQGSRPQPAKESPSPKIVSLPKAKPQPLLSSSPPPPWASSPPPASPLAPAWRPAADYRESGLERYLRMAGFRAETASGAASTSASTSAPAAASDDEASPEGPWEGHLEKAIRCLESQAQSADDPYGQALLRVLYAVAGRRDDALRPIADLAETEREFWVNEMRGLTDYLDTRQTASPDRRAGEAARWFRDAAGRLAELGALDVRNLAFCTAVHSFGSLDRFPKNDFSAGDEVLLYAEIENFTSESTKAGYRTSLKARCEIFQGAGRVHEQELPVAEETCERKRRDFFLSYHLRLPATLKPGEYTLQLSIDDTLGRKTATRSIGLRIK